MSCCAGAGGMAAFVRNGYGAFQEEKFEHDCYKIMVFKVCGESQNFYLFSHYCNLT